MTDDDRAGDGLPIKFGPVSTGEFYPMPHTPVVKETIRRTYRMADDHARRLGISRRRFLTSASGAAATLFMLNACSKEEAASRGESPGGEFDVPPETTLDNEAAIEALGGEEFIFDVQSHFIDFDMTAAPVPDLGAALPFPQASCAEGEAAGDARTCFTVEAYMREMFVRSDTAMAVLSALPSPPLGTEFTNQEGLIAREAARQLGCDERVLLHGGAYPHVGGDVEAALLGMTAAIEEHPIVAWKIYTMVPSEAAFYFDDHDPNLAQIGQRFIDHVREIGPPIICTHRGISSIVGSTVELASPSDIGPAAARNPDISFVVYHSGFEPGSPEGPYDPANPDPQGIDRLIRSVLDAGIGPNENVYAELGGTWWFAMQNPDTAAHVLGKLLRYIGEDRVVWGTDSIWFGTPQDQIQAMRTFEISEELQERHGYPALTDELKAKIFGLTSAALYGIDPEGACRLDLDDIQLARAELPPARTYGPATLAEAARHIRAHQGVPFV